MTCTMRGHAVARSPPTSARACGCVPSAAAAETARDRPAGRLNVVNPMRSNCGATPIHGSFASGLPADVVHGVVAWEVCPTGRPACGRTAGAGAAWSTPRGSMIVERALRCSFSGRLGPGQHRRDAGVGACEDLGPLGAGPAREAFGEDRAHLVVAVEVELAGHLVGRQAEAAEQLREELRFDRCRRPCTCRRRSRRSGRTARRRRA